MKIVNRRGLVLIAAAILLFDLTAAAQKRPNFDRPRTYDVQNYIIRVSFDPTAKKVDGDTTVELTPLSQGFRSFELDAVGMTFQSVKLESVRLELEAGPVEHVDRDLKFQTTDDKIKVSLDREFRPGEVLSVRFKYSTEKPKKGVYFVDELKENGADFDAQIWSQGEPEEARYWFPSFDFPSDKATSEEFFTVPKGQTVIGNGVRLDDIENSDGTVTAHYKMSVPYSTYLTSFVIGKYVRIDDKYGDIPLGFYVYPGKEAIAPIAFANTKKMMAAYEDMTGVKFPYNKYDQTIVRNFQFGGMENITATTHADTEVFMANYGFGVATVEDLVSHELAHSWFGDLVTCKNWSELWLNEGFATFMEAAWRERGYGHDSYIRKLRSDAEQAIADDATSRRRHGLYNVLAKPDDSLFDTTTYQKGGTVVHMLRQQVGDEAFWRAINNYLTAHKFDNVTSEDLQKAMEQASGQNLDWFFNQWVYGAGLPHLAVRQSYLPASKTYRITVSQTQKPDGVTPPAFRLPIDLVITTAPGKKRSDKINITKRSQVFTFKVDGKPTDLKLDPEEKIILKTVKINPLGK